MSTCVAGSVILLRSRRVYCNFLYIIIIIIIIRRKQKIVPPQPSLLQEEFEIMTDSLARYGLYIDDLWKIRLLEPEVANQSEKLRLECENFISKITEFEKNTNKFIEIIDDLGKEVEKEKMRTIGARNLLRSVEKQKEARKQQIQALIVEKTMELERLRVEQDSLRKIQQEQLETIEHLSVN